MEKIRLKLYIAGRTDKTQRALDNLSKICEKELKGKYELTVIDILERPQLAEDEKILATPTLIRELPVPIRSIVGDLSEIERVLIGLDLTKIEEEEKQ